MRVAGALRFECALFGAVVPAGARTAVLPSKIEVKMPTAEPAQVRAPADDVAAWVLVC